MTNRFFAFLVALGAALPLGAQTDHGPTHIVQAVGRVDIITRTPRCNPFRLEHDALWIHGEGWTMPSVAWHVFYPGVEKLIIEGLKKARVPAGVAEWGTSLSFAFGPHGRQMFLGLRHGQRYELNAIDYVYDANDRTFWLQDHSRSSLIRWAVVDLSTACSAIP
jgi:hypothetical protein